MSRGAREPCFVASHPWRHIADRVGGLATARARRHPTCTERNRTLWIRGRSNVRGCQSGDAACTSCRALNRRAHRRQAPSGRRAASASAAAAARSRLAIRMAGSAARPAVGRAAGYDSTSPRLPLSRCPVASRRGRDHRRSARHPGDPGGARSRHQGTSPAGDHRPRPLGDHGRLRPPRLNPPPPPSRRGRRGCSCPPGADRSVGHAATLVAGASSSVGRASDF